MRHVTFCGQRQTNELAGFGDEDGCPAAAAAAAAAADAADAVDVDDAVACGSDSDSMGSS